MKKLLLVLGIMALAANGASASNCAYQCVEPYDLSNGASRFMSAVTGSNFLGEQVAKVLLKKEILKNAEGKISTKVDSYSVKDLKKGIFKSILVKGKDLEMEGVHFTSLQINTLCDFNYISMEDPKNPVFKEDLPLAFSVVMTEDDLNNTMMSDDYKRIIENINMLGSGMFNVSSSKIKIRNNKLFYILKVSLPFVKNTQNIVLATDLKVVKGEIDFTNTKLINDSLTFDLRKADKLINYLNPLDFSLNILENRDAELTVQNVKIQDNKIYADGFLVIPKD